MKAVSRTELRRHYHVYACTTGHPEGVEVRGQIETLMLMDDPAAPQMMVLETYRNIPEFEMETDWLRVLRVVDGQDEGRGEFVPARIADFVVLVAQVVSPLLRLHCAEREACLRLGIRELREEGR